MRHQWASDDVPHSITISMSTTIINNTCKTNKYNIYIYIYIYIYTNKKSNLIHCRGLYSLSQKLVAAQITERLYIVN